MKSSTPYVALTFIVAFLLIIDFFIPGLNLTTITQEIQNWAVIIAAFALGLAAVNLTRIHGRRISLRRENWINSILLLFFLFYMIIVGIGLGTEHELYAFGFDNILTPLGSTMYAMLAFWIASAAYRSFIARSVEATILLISAALVMIGNAPIGNTIWTKFPEIGSWLTSVPNTAAMRGIMIGAAIGAIAFGIRIMLGIERGYLGSDNS